MIKLKESPNRLDFPEHGINRHWASSDAIVFGYGSKTDKFLYDIVGNHPELYDDNMDEFNDASIDSWNDTNATSQIRKEIKFAGRLWSDKKAISFWTYPSTSEMQKIIKDIKNILKINIIPKEWMIEVVPLENEPDKYETTTANKSEYDIKMHSNLISLDKYMGSADANKADMGQSHLLSPMLKGKQDVPSGMGSEKRPGNISQSEKDRLTRTSDGTIKLKNLVNESPDELHYLGNKSWGSDDAIAFGFNKNLSKCFLTKRMHSDIRGYTRGTLEYPGRMWMNEKIISFWEYPRTYEMMKKTIKLLEETLKVYTDKRWTEDNLDVIQTIIDHRPIKIWDEFELDVPIPDEDDDEYRHDFLKDSEKIKLSTYKGGDMSFKNVDHIKSPMLKGKRDVPSSMGSHKRPGNLSQSQRHDISMTSDGITYIDIKLIIERLICQPELKQMKEYAKAAIRDVFIQMPTRSIFKKYWESYRYQIASELGEEDTNKAWKELHDEKFIHEDEASGTYMWRRSFGPVNSPSPIKSHTLTEWADNMLTQQRKYHYKDKQAIPFIYNEEDDTVYFGQFSGTHNSVYQDEDARISFDMIDDYKSLKSGRLWVIDKIISFWQYPKNVEDLDDIIDSINKNNIDDISMDSSWKIDVPMENGGLQTFDYFDKKSMSNFIKLEDYDPKIIINPKKYGAVMMKEEILEEDAKHEYGCLMIMLKFPRWKEMIEKMIDPSDVFEKEGEDYGLEYETHITVLFGFHENTDINKVKQLILNKEYERISVLFSKISHFETPEFDVVKFEVESPQLNELNEIMINNFDYTSNHPIYNPHCTIAYVKKGMGSKYDKKLKNMIRLYSNNFKYSYQNGKNEYFNI